MGKLIDFLLDLMVEFISLVAIFTLERFTNVVTISCITLTTALLSIRKMATEQIYEPQICRSECNTLREAGPGTWKQPRSLRVPGPHLCQLNIPALWIFSGSSEWPYISSVTYIRSLARILLFKHEFDSLFWHDFLMVRRPITVKKWLAPSWDFPSLFYGSIWTRFS